MQLASSETPVTAALHWVLMNSGMNLFLVKSASVLRTYSQHGLRQTVRKTTPEASALLLHDFLLAYTIRSQPQFYLQLVYKPLFDSRVVGMDTLSENLSLRPQQAMIMYYLFQKTKTQLLPSLNTLWRKIRFFMSYIITFCIMFLMILMGFDEF